MTPTPEQQASQLGYCWTLGRRHSGKHSKKKTCKEFILASDFDQPGTCDRIKIPHPKASHPTQCVNWKPIDSTPAEPAKLKPILPNVHMFDSRDEPAPAEKPMKMNTSKEWLLKRAAAEENCDVSVGRLAEPPTPTSTAGEGAREWLEQNRVKFLTGELVYPYGHSKEKIEYLNEVALLEAYADYKVDKRTSELVRVARALHDKLQEIDKHPSLAEVFAIAHIHGSSYTGPNWTEELAALASVLDREGK